MDENMILWPSDDFEWTCTAHSDQVGSLEVENGIGYWTCPVNGCKEDEVVVND